MFFMGQIFWALGALENFKKLKFSTAPRAQNICPMKKISGAKNAQNHPKNSFFVLRSW